MGPIGRTVRNTAVAVLLIVAACGTDDHPEQTPSATASTVPLTVVPAADYTFPTQWAGDYTFRWSAADGLDLTTPDAQVVRAFAESKRLAMSVGNRLAYPGYATAVSAVDWLTAPDGGAYPPGAEQGTWNLRWDGTFLARIMRLQTTGRGFTAAYCLDYTNVADSIDGGTHYRWNRPGARGEPRRGWLIGFTAETLPDGRHRRSATFPLASGQPPHRAPRYNVFSGVAITEVWGPTPHDADTMSLVDECTAWTRANPQTNPVGIDSAERRIPADPPPTPDDPFPGWPES
ncbi:hypothetical protein AB0M22_21175 [Nocardia sp. NPDC051756]|uniref:hypothetical protein n=1 Tax=Nocardia sp. NPDC051756 TaxID=3154751 RepID=UPI00342D6AA8